MSLRRALEEVAASLAAGIAGRLAAHAEQRLAGGPAADAACRLGSELAELLVAQLDVVDEAPPRFKNRVHPVVVWEDRSHDHVS